MCDKYICSAQALKRPLKLVYHFGQSVSYSWIGRPVQTHTKSICRETERAMYDGFEYTDEKLSTRRIQWLCAKVHIFIFWRVILKKQRKYALKKLYGTVGSASLKALISTEVSGASEVPQSQGKLFF